MTERRLGKIFTKLMHHKLEWIEKSDRDFGDDLPIITDILIERVEEER